jgi:hypothetical protein
MHTQTHQHYEKKWARFTEDKMKKQIKAVSLITGGLDLLLSTKLMLYQGVHVEGINFFTGFCV